MKKTISIILVCLFVLALVGVVTCPDKEAYQTAIKEELGDAVNESMNENLKIGNSKFEQGLAMMGSALASSLIGGVLDGNLKVNNYFVFSTGELSYMGKNKMVSVGLLGHIFVFFEADDIKDYMKLDK